MNTLNEMQNAMEPEDLVESLFPFTVGQMNMAATWTETEGNFNPFAKLSGDAFGHLLLQYIGQFLPIVDGGATKELERDYKVAALETAQVLGPDHAQTLYRFAVLVTKLA